MFDCGPGATDEATRLRELEDLPRVRRLSLGS
jgi:hypothetical protein